MASSADFLFLVRNIEYNYNVMLRHIDTLDDFIGEGFVDETTEDLISEVQIYTEKLLHPVLALKSAAALANALEKIGNAGEVG